MIKDAQLRASKCRIEDGTPPSPIATGFVVPQCLSNGVYNVHLSDPFGLLTYHKINIIPEP